MDLCPRGDLSSESGEISLNLGLNSKTGEGSPDRGVHAVMVASQSWLASSRLALRHGLPVEPERHESVRRDTGIACVAGDNRVTEDGWRAETGTRYPPTA